MSCKSPDQLKNLRDNRDQKHDSKYFKIIPQTPLFRILKFKKKYLQT